MKKYPAYRKNNILHLILSIAIALGVGFLSSLLSGDTREVYQRLILPSFAPPGWIFPVVWTIMYVLMGIAAYRVYSRGPRRPQVRSALSYYAVQLFFNFLWSIIFFRFELFGFAFIWLLILWFLIIVTTSKFFRLDKLAGYLMLPYLLWVTFAGILNFAIWRLN